MIIMTDSTSDLTYEEAEALGVEMYSLKVIFGNRIYEDKRTITNVEFYEKLRTSKELPTTSLVSAGEWLDAFRAHPDDDIIVLPLSSGLSGTYAAAWAARDETGRRNIHVIETSTICVGLSMLVKLAVKMRAEGKPVGEIVRYLTRVAPRIRIYVVPETLRYLIRGGRLSLVTGAVGELLSVKPIAMLQNGVVKNMKKARGMNAALNALVEIIMTQFPPDLSMPAAYAHAGNFDGVQALAAKLPFVTHEEPAWMGSVVGTHCGPGSVVVAYFQLA